jgi:short-subunit dehydrogenase
MRVQGTGRIVQVSSLAARIGIPFQGAYAASKAALSRMGEALSIELAPFAIEVVLVEPGDTRTEFTGMREWTGAARTSQTYGARARHAIAVMEASERKGAPADKVARTIERALTAEKPKLCYVSANLTERSLLFLLGVIPARAFERLMRSIYEPPRR